MKANWNKFPWANYRAQDPNGSMWYFKNKPLQKNTHWSDGGGEAERDFDLIYSRVKVEIH